MVLPHVINSVCNPTSAKISPGYHVWRGRWLTLLDTYYWRKNSLRYWGHPILWHRLLSSIRQSLQGSRALEGICSALIAPTKSQNSPPYSVGVPGIGIDAPSWYERHTSWDVEFTEAGKTLDRSIRFEPPEVTNGMMKQRKETSHLTHLKASCRVEQGEMNRSDKVEKELMHKAILWSKLGVRRNCGYGACTSPTRMAKYVMA